jgi:hypothetical protein
VCRRAEESVDDAAAGLLREQVNDAEFQNRLLQSRGFCRDHAWRLVRTRDILGIALLHRSLLERLEHRPSGAASARCPLCVSREKAETMAMDTLVMHLSEPELLDRIAKSDGLCQRHLEVAVARCHDSAALIDAQATDRGRLVKDLDELIRKHDYRFSGEADKVEGQAWLRAVAAVSGLDVAALRRSRSR